MQSGSADPAARTAASPNAGDPPHVIIEPNSPSRGVLVAFIEVRGAPVELMQIDHQARPDL